jgi:hypothetical protein
VRVGCLGCLTVILILGGVAELGWIGVQALREPEFQLPGTAPGDGVRAQRKIYQISQVARHGPGRGVSGGGPIVLTQGELNAFLSRHLVEAAELPFADLALRLTGDGTVEFRGRLPLAHLVTEPPLSGMGHVLPAVLLERPVWLMIRAHARVEPGVTRRERRYLRLDVREFAVGRQGLPAVLLRILLDPRTLGVLRWPLPDSIEAITIEPGRVVIRLAS